MSRIVRWTVLGLTVLLGAGMLTACGEEPEVHRDALPFTKVRLKNAAANRAATAVAEGRLGTATKPPLTAGPVPAGDTGQNTPDGTEACDGVRLTVNFEGGPTFKGMGNFPGMQIGMVDITCDDTSGGHAIVNFASGEPPQTITLTP